MTGQTKSAMGNTYTADIYSIGKASRFGGQRYVDFAKDYICLVYEGVNKGAPR